MPRWSAVSKLLWSKIALNRWMTTDKLWNRKAISLSLSHHLTGRRYFSPRSFKNWQDIIIYYYYLPWVDIQLLLLGSQYAKVFHKPISHAARTRAWFHKTSVITTLSNSSHAATTNSWSSPADNGLTVPTKCPVKRKLNATTSTGIDGSADGSNWIRLKKSTVLMNQSQTSENNRQMTTVGNINGIIPSNNCYLLFQQHICQHVTNNILYMLLQTVFWDRSL